MHVSSSPRRLSIECVNQVAGTRSPPRSPPVSLLVSAGGSGGDGGGGGGGGGGEKSGRAVLRSKSLPEQLATWTSPMKTTSSHDLLASNVSPRLLSNIFEEPLQEGEGDVLVKRVTFTPFVHRGRGRSVTDPGTKAASSEPHLHVTIDAVDSEDELATDPSQLLGSGQRGNVLGVRQHPVPSSSASASSSSSSSSSVQQTDPSAINTATLGSLAALPWLCETASSPVFVEAETCLLQYPRVPFVVVPFGGKGIVGPTLRTKRRWALRRGRDLYFKALAAESVGAHEASCDFLARVFTLCDWETVE